MSPRPLSICLVSREYPPETGYGGIGTYYMELAQALSARGHTVVVLSQSFNANSYSNEGKLHIYRVKTRFDVSRVPFLWRLNKYWQGYRLTVALKLRELIRQYQIDLIECSEILADTFLYSLLPCHLPLVVRLHSGTALAAKYNKTPPIARFVISRRLENWLVQRATYITAPSKALIEASRSAGVAVPLLRCSVIPNPIDTDIFRPCPHTEPDCQILFVGRLEPWKGPDILAEAIPRIAEQFPNAVFHFVGTTDQDLYGRQAIQSLKALIPVQLHHHLLFSGKVERQHLMLYYHQATVVVVPSRWEGFGYVCAEAMACGRPVIASNIGGLAEIIQDGISGLLFEPENQNALADGIIRVLGSPALQQELGQQGRQRIVENYAVPHIAERLLLLYQQVTENSR